MKDALRAWLLAAVVALSACDRSGAREVEPRLALRDVHSHVKLGTTTPADVERLFGAPDQRAEDGALVYESQHARRSGTVDHETTTFRFEGGVLSKVCQSRS